jgi:hypothetical protein
MWQTDRKPLKRRHARGVIDEVAGDRASRVHVVSKANISPGLPRAMDYTSAPANSFVCQHPLKLASQISGFGSQ